MSRRRRVSTEPILGWIGDLPESGTGLRRLVAEEARLLAEAARLAREREVLLGEVTVLRTRAIGCAREQWTAEEIERTRAATAVRS